MDGEGSERNSNGFEEPKNELGKSKGTDLLKYQLYRISYEYSSDTVN